MQKVSWGILSTAKIGLDKVIPAMQKGKYSEIVAISSRDIRKAQEAAHRLKIPKVYGSYEELLADKEIEAIYIPLPNHLHVKWTIESLESGKHVLCEKPIGLNSQEAEYLLNEAAKYPELKVMEAFMYRHHPQYRKIKELIENEAIGELTSIQSNFSYYNANPNDIRNKVEIGGGGLLDVGCYCISLSRFLFDEEPKKVCGTIDRDPQLKIDRLTSGILQFEKGLATFTCSTQMIPHSGAELFGTEGRIEIESPFVPPPGESTKITLQTGSDAQVFSIDACNQYTIQGDLFSKAILDHREGPTPLTDAVANMKVIDGIFDSAYKNAWVELV